MHPLNSTGLVCMSAQNGGTKETLLERNNSFSHTVSATCSTGSLEAKGPSPHVLQSEFWKAVDGPCVRRASRVAGQKGAEEQIPLLAVIHPRDAEEILQYALNLVPVCTKSGMANIALLGESESKVEVCVCCCCTRNET